MDSNYSKSPSIILGSDNNKNEITVIDADTDNNGNNKQTILEQDFRLAVEKALTNIAELPNNWNDLTVGEQRVWVYNEHRRYCGTDMPESLTRLWVGSTINCDGVAAGNAGIGGGADCATNFDAPPDWLDRVKFRRGQIFAMNHYAGISFAEMLSLYMLFSFDDGLKPLIVTGKSSEPFTAFKRYLSTGTRVRNWYTTDVWTPGTQAHRDIRAVRRMHASVRKKLGDYSSYREIEEAAKIENMSCCNKSWKIARGIDGNDNTVYNDDVDSISASTPNNVRRYQRYQRYRMIRDDFRGSCKAPAPRQCPYVFGKDDRFKRPKGLNQFDMSATQFGFMALIVLYPRSFGIHDSSDQDLDDFCHLWRGLGYLLGIQDEFNFCKGTLEEVKQRSRDFIEYWVKSNFRDITPEWEHMTRCVIEGISYYLPGVSYEHCLLYLTDTIGIQMPQLRASLSYTAWIRFNLIKFMFTWAARLSGVRKTMNLRVTRRMDRALEYNDEKLASLRKRSDITLEKQRWDTVIDEDDPPPPSPRPTTEATTTAHRYWRNFSFFACFLSGCCFLIAVNLPIIVKNYAGKLISIDVS